MRVVAVREELDLDDGLIFAAPDDPDVGGGKQPTDALRSGYFDAPRAGHHRNAAIGTGEKHSWREGTAGRSRFETSPPRDGDAICKYILASRWQGP